MKASETLGMDDARQRRPTLLWLPADRCNSGAGPRDTVNTASRMESNALPGTIQVTERAHERLRRRFELRQRGTIEVKGKGQMTIYLLICPNAVSAPPTARLPHKP